MSDNNKNEERIDQQQDHSDGQSSRKNKILEYIFVPGEDSAIFQIVYQHPLIATFLGTQTNGSFMASNGIRVALGILHPEWKESKNTIYLDGTNGVRLNKIDVTRFPSNGRVYRDNKMRMFNQALEELVEAIKGKYDSVLNIKERSAVKRITL